MSASVLDYLTSVLSQRGPSAVPYDEAVKWNIRDHVSELQKVFPTLSSKLSEYHANDGRHLNLLKVEGTIPIHYQGAKYNIPILMWLTERYPYTAPLVYVVPTANMIIRANDFVNPSGQVSTPHIRSWLFPSSNLVEVVLEMSQVFGGEPPLYTRPPGYVSPPDAQSPAVTQPPASYPTSSTTASNTPAATNTTSTGAPSTYPSVGPAGTGLTPFVTPSVGNTPQSTPGTAPGGGSMATLWATAAAAAASSSPASGYPSINSNVHPPPPPPPQQQQPQLQQTPGSPQPLAGFGSLIYNLGSKFGPGSQLAQQGHQQQHLPVQPPPPPPPPPTHAGPSRNQSPARMSQPPPPPPPPPPPVPEPPRGPQLDLQELDVHFRHLAIEALATQLRALQRKFSVHATEETEKALELQHQLNDRRAKLQEVHDELTQERIGTEQMVAELANKTRALAAWLDRNEQRAARFNPDAGPVSNYLLPVDALCRQGMETQARDLAIEDTILALDKLLQTGQVPLEAYLKQVRSLCRKQFFSRALGLKVAGAQQAGAAQQVPPSATPGYQAQPYPIAHGDGWAHAVSPPVPPQVVPQVGAMSGQALRPPTSGLGPTMIPASTGMLMNPLAGR